MQKGSLSEPSGAVGRWDHEFRLRNRWCGSEVGQPAELSHIPGCRSYRLFSWSFTELTE